MTAGLNNKLKILIACLLLMLPALYNGYPLVYSDIGTYIRSGLEMVLPMDRPIFYGLFVRMSSFKFSLWPVIFSQCLLCSFILFLSYKQVVKNAKYFLIFISFLVAFTGIAWYTGQIMPDIFSSVGILCLFLLFQAKQLSFPEKILVSLILVFSVNVHFSNLAIYLFLIILIFIIRKRRIINLRVNFKLPIALLALSVLIASFTNFIAAKTFKINQGSHAFLMARMLDTGLLKSFLDEKCDANNYILCPYKDSLPKDSRAFLWDANSPLQKNGEWQNSESANNEILTNIFTSPKYCILFLYHGLISGASQLMQNDIGSGLISTWYEDASSPPYSQIATHFPQELNPYLKSRQNTNLWGQKLDFSLLNNINYILLTLSAVFLLCIFSNHHIWNAISIQSQFFILIIISGVLINAFVTGALANVYDRLQARVSWLIIFLALIIFIAEHRLILHTLKNKFKDK